MAIIARHFRTRVRRTVNAMRLFIYAVLILAPQTSHAIQASPHPIVITQPDGSSAQLFIRGDQDIHWHEDENGFTVVHDQGRYVYGQLDEQQHLQPTTLQVGTDSPASRGLKKHLRPSTPSVQRISPSDLNSQQGGLEVIGGTSTPSNITASGTIKNLVIMIRFSDHASRPLPVNPDIEILFNSVGGDPSLAPTGSVRDYYLANSYNQMTLDSTVVGWIDLPNTEAYYANGQSGDSTLWQALTNALSQVDASINFSDFDNDNDGFIDSIAFIHSGYGAEWGGTDQYGAVTADRIWSHRWSIQPSWTSSEGVKVKDYHISPGVWGTSGSAIGRIGVIVHETGHFFGLPDLYDTDGSGSGIGSWGVMANSWGFDNSQLRPPHFSAWSKIQLGWLTPTTISATNTYSINQAITDATVYRIDVNFPSNEYLLIENRQAGGFETNITQGGLAIWHIDDAAGYNTEGYPGQSGWPENGNHYRVALLQADSDYDMEHNTNRGDSGDLYHGNGTSEINKDTVPNTDAYQSGIIGDTNIRIYNISTTNATMTFDLDQSTITTPTYAVRQETHENNWIDTSQGTAYLLNNDDSITVATNFNFDFYGNNKTSVTISSNGYLTFGASGTEPANTTLPEVATPNDLIAPFWDDFAPDLGGNVEVLTDGTTPLRRFTVTWNNVAHSSTTGTAKFQATLYEINGDIVFRYNDVDLNNAAYNSGASATIGIENNTGDDATLYSFNQSNLSAGLALRFSSKKDVLLVDDDDNSPDVRSSYTMALDTAGANYDVWPGSSDPGLSDLQNYKSIVWFTGDKFDSTTGPSATGVTTLQNYLDAGGCMAFSSQDYYYSTGQVINSFTANYLGAATISNDVGQTSASSNGVEFSGLGPYTLSFPAGYSNFTDIVTPAASANTVFTGNLGPIGISKTTSNYRTTFWGYPFEALPTATDKADVMSATITFCLGREIDTDLDGTNNAIDSDDDNDGLTDSQEATLGTQVLNPDSDQDGYTDGEEVAAGSDPLDQNSVPTLGDINNDGIINAADVLMATRFILGLDTPSASEFQSADVGPLINNMSSPDGTLTVGDVLLIQRRTHGLIAF